MWNLLEVMGDGEGILSKRKSQYKRPEAGKGLVPSGSWAKVVGVGHRALKAVPRSWDFMHSAVGSHQKVLRGTVTGIALAAVWRRVVGA